MTMFTNNNARRRSVIWVLMMIAVVSLSVAGSSSAFAMGTGGGSTTNPWIQSDQADYGPGSTVTLNGGNWAPGENVHVFVDDANGHTWNHSADVTADDSGLIQDVWSVELSMRNAQRNGRYVMDDAGRVMSSSPDDSARRIHLPTDRKGESPR